MASSAGATEMSKKSIIPQVEMGEKSPFNKKLLLIVALVAGAAVVFAALLGRSASNPSEEVKEVEENPFTEGTSRDVKFEFDAYKPDPSPKLIPSPPPEAPRDTPIPGGQTGTRYGNRTTSDTGVDVNNSKEDLQAQASISTISVAYTDETQGARAALIEREKTPEEMIAELYPRMPEKISEEEALRRSIAMTAQAQAMVASQNGGDSSVETALAAKTKRFIAESERQNNLKISRRNSAPGQWVVTAGKTIPAITKRAQNSDLPCAVEAITSVDVYDSYTSTKKLIPKGSELIGLCSNDIAFGQNRILSVFSRLILPNGEWFDLASGVGMDRHGATGLKGDVDNHFFQMFSSAFLIAFLADRVDNNKRTERQNNVYMGNSAGAKSAAGQVLVDTSQHMLGRNKRIQPTIDVEAGTRIYIQVKHDMVFD